eukprot:2334446-Pyramimonas_sp.AAC.1
MSPHVHVARAFLPTRIRCSSLFTAMAIGMLCQSSQQTWAASLWFYVNLLLISCVVFSHNDASSKAVKDIPKKWMGALHTGDHNRNVPLSANEATAKVGLMNQSMALTFEQCVKVCKCATAPTTRAGFRQLTHSNLCVLAQEGAPARSEVSCNTVKSDWRKNKHTAMYRTAGVLAVVIPCGHTFYDTCPTEASMMRD